MALVLLRLLQTGAAACSPCPAGYQPSSAAPAAPDCPSGALNCVINGTAENFWGGYWSQFAYYGLGAGAATIGQYGCAHCPPGAMAGNYSFGVAPPSNQYGPGTQGSYSAYQIADAGIHTIYLRRLVSVGKPQFFSSNFLQNIKQLEIERKLLRFPLQKQCRKSHGAITPKALYSCKGSCQPHIHS